MFSIKVIFFASFRELLNCSEIELQLETDSSVIDLCQLLANRGECWQRIFSDAKTNVKIACNQEMAEFSLLLKEGDEVAFFPPVTGG